MALPEEQVKSIKKQIIQQINSWDRPEEQKKQAKQQIESMNSQQLEDFLKKNNMIKDSESESQNIQQTQCPLCLMSQGKMKLYKIGENEKSFAVLEIKPISKSHTMVIPKKHCEVENLPLESFDLALKVSKLIKQKLNPNEITLSTANFTGHAVINIVPSFGDETGERKNASEEELVQLQKQLLDQPQENQGQQQPDQQPVQQQPKQSKPKEPKEIPEVPRRIP